VAAGVYYKGMNDKNGVKKEEKKNT